MQTRQLPLIETPRTLLTVLQPDYAHLALEYQLQNREHLAPWEPIRDAGFFSYESSCKRAEIAYSDYINCSALKLIAIDRNFRKMIGLCYFTNITAGAYLGCNMGYSVAKEFEGKGLMKEIAVAGINYIFDVVGLHRITACYMPKNVKSEMLLKSLGFEPEGYAKSYLKISGHWEDMVICSLINH